MAIGGRTLSAVVCIDMDGYLYLSPMGDKGNMPGECTRFDQNFNGKKLPQNS